LEPCADPAVLREMFLDAASDEPAVLDNGPSAHHGVPRGDGAAAQPGFHRVGQSARERDALEGPADEVAHCTGHEQSELTLAP
jgi:hypothetical protein